MKERAGILQQREEIILMLLSGKELYGLQIIHAIAQVSGGTRKVNLGSLYPALHNLEGKKLIVARWGDEGSEEKNAARRRYYKHTQKGSEVLSALQSFHKGLVEWKPD